METIPHSVVVESTEHHAPVLLNNGAELRRNVHYYIPQDETNGKPYYDPGWNSGRSTLNTSGDFWEQLGITIRENNNDQDLYNNVLGLKNFLDDDTAEDEHNKLLVEEYPQKIWSDRFQPGKVVYGNQNAISHMLQDYTKWKDLALSHGVILSENLTLKDSFYNEESHEKEGQYTVKAELGKGSYGVVELVKDDKTMAEVVRKTILKDFHPSEIATPRDHQNLMKVYGFLIQNKKPVIFSEYCGQSLVEFVHIPEKYALLSEDKNWNIVQQGLSGLRYLANYGCIHHDIKPENLCLSETDGNFLLKITDFGSARTPQDPLTFKGFTPEYLAPELAQLFLNSLKKNGIQFPITDDEVTGKVDVYAFALSIVYLYRKKHPIRALYTNGEDSYKNVSEPKKLQLKMIFDLAKNPECVEMLVPDECTQDMKLVLQGMLKGNQLIRYSAEKALLLMKKLEDLKVVSQVIAFVPQDARSPAILKPKRKVKQLKVESKGEPSTVSPKPSVMTIPKSVFNPVEQTNWKMPVRSATKTALRRKINAAPYQVRESTSQPSTPVTPEIPATPIGSIGACGQPEEVEPYSVEGNMPNLLFDMY